MLQDAGQLPGPSPLLHQLSAISETFSGSTLMDIYAALRARGDDWSKETLATLSKWVLLCPQKHDFVAALQHKPGMFTGVCTWDKGLAPTGPKNSHREDRA